VVWLVREHQTDAGAAAKSAGTASRGPGMTLARHTDRRQGVMVARRAVLGKG
jgi:hypothetical protein